MILCDGDVGWGMDIEFGLFLLEFDEILIGDIFDDDFWFLVLGGEFFLLELLGFVMNSLGIILCWCVFWGWWGSVGVDGLVLVDLVEIESCGWWDILRLCGKGLFVGWLNNVEVGI